MLPRVGGAVAAPRRRVGRWARRRALRWTLLWALRRKKHPVRNVLAVLISLVVLASVGCVALIAVTVHEISQAIEQADAEESEVERTDDPLTIQPGKRFEVRGFDYSAGWRVREDTFGEIVVTGLEVTNHRSRKDSALLDIRFMRGSAVLAFASCITEPIPVGQTTSVHCVSADKLPGTYERITINDTI
jgi:hypothetical protein